MNFRKKITYSFSSVVFPLFLHAQNPSSDLALISNHIQTYREQNIQTHSVHIQKSSNPLKIFLYVPLYLYQKILSEQISAGCEFDRSCSNYSITAIKEFGFIKGICLTADRLSRCNGQAQVESQGYLINHTNGKTIDEPSMYRFKE